jgi:mRNA interferase RelE/StbE
MGGRKEGFGTVKEWQIIILPIAEKQLLAIKDTRVRQSIGNRISSLQYDPDKQGKPLMGGLEDFRSLRAVGQRYRIIYKIEADRVIVSIVTIGIRKEGDRIDVYALAKRLVRLGLLDNE